MAPIDQLLVIVQSALLQQTDGLFNVRPDALGPRLEAKHDRDPGGMAGAQARARIFTERNAKAGGLRPPPLMLLLHTDECDAYFNSVVLTIADMIEPPTFCVVFTK